MTHSLWRIWRIWRIPATLAALTLFGLLAALIGMEPWHGLAWLALLVPLTTGLWHALRRRRPVPILAPTPEDADACPP